jgi:hypothetical protein
MIDLLEDSPVDNHMLASILLAQAGLPTMEGSCECGYCPITIEKFEIDVHRILITANGREYELLVNADRADRDDIRADPVAEEALADMVESLDKELERLSGGEEE